MKKRTLLAAVIVASTLFTVSAVIYAQAQKPAQTSTATLQSVPLNATTIFTLVNAERTKAGLSPLIRDSRLDASAQAKADDMAQNNYFDHVSPTTGKHGYEYIPKGMCSTKSENLTETVFGEVGDFSKNSVTSWMNSKSHREAILNKAFTHTGVAISQNKVVQHFCIAK